MSFYDVPPYVPVAERRAKARKNLEKLVKKGCELQPVQLTGRKIADSFWGKGGCEHMESFSDYSNRLPRGRSYVRNGLVCHLEIFRGGIKAIVSGSTLYNVSITISPLANKKWVAVKSACTGRIGSLIDLLRGKLDRGVMEVVADRREGLFPLPGEMKFSCDCPDWADMCKHVAAVLYGVGARLDHSPEMLFLLRGVNHAELVNVSTAVTIAATSGTSRRRIAPGGLADLFGVEMAEAGEGETTSTISSKRSRDTVKQPDNSVIKTKSTTQASPPKIAARKKKTATAHFPKPLTGDAIFFWRSALGETQALFAAHLRISAATVSQWEKKGPATLGMLPRTLSALKKAWKDTHP